MANSNPKKSRFFWAVVGNGTPEPVAVAEKGGRKVVYTIGCPDPIYVDEGAVAFVGWEKKSPTPMVVPPTPAEWEEAERREKEWKKQMGSHGYQGWGR